MPLTNTFFQEPEKWTDLLFLLIPLCQPTANSQQKKENRSESPENLILRE
jgi:hypothetical protein